jgi:surface antigen
MKRVLPILLLTLQLGGCVPSQECPCPEDCYKITQTPIPASVLYEAYSGSVIACSLPMHDRLIAAYNAQRTLKDSQLNLPYYWESPLWPFKGTFELLSFHQERNTTCFKYKQMINIDGAILTAQGLACKDPYQVWRIVNEIPDTNPWLDSDPHGGFKASPELKTRLSRFIN